MTTDGYYQRDWLPPPMSDLPTRVRFQYRGKDYPGRKDAAAEILVWLGDDAIIAPVLRYQGGKLPDWLPLAIHEPLRRLWAEHQGSDHD
jgi:hypothetical protein